MVTEKDDTFSYTVAECRFNNIKCLIAGEPDCNLHSGKDEEGFIEIKSTTRNGIKNKSAAMGWLQAYLLGDRKVVYGIRNNEFVLQDVLIEYVMDVPEKYGVPGRWRGTDMLVVYISPLTAIFEIRNTKRRGFLLRSYKILQCFTFRF